MIILKRKENLGSLTETEWQNRNARLLSANERLTCQFFIYGDIIIKVPDIYKLPHVKYSD